MNYKLLGNSGLRVSELCLGTMTFGREWGWGCDEATSKSIFDAFTDAGGNFIDTANIYTEGTSEKYVGKFIKSDRHHYVLATKYSLHDRQEDVNFSGNSRKNLMRSVEDSLKRLDTGFIDLLWIHAWDFMTPTDEVMRSLDDIVCSGKVNYIGISNTPAWIVSRANTLSEMMGWAKFIGLQIEYSLIARTAERELLPMAAELGIGVTPWAPLGRGLLTGKYLRGESGRITEAKSQAMNPVNLEIAKKTAEIAALLYVTPAQLAIAWILKKDPSMIPIIGATSTQQLDDNAGKLDFSIPDEFMQQLDQVSAIELGYPHDYLNSEQTRGVVSGNMWNRIQKARPSFRQAPG